MGQVSASLSEDLSQIVWLVLTLRVFVFVAAVLYLTRRSLRLLRAIEERKFAARYDIRIILKGVFSPFPGWQLPFKPKDIEVLRSTRTHLVLLVALTLAVAVVQQQGRVFVERKFQELDVSNRPNEALRLDVSLVSTLERLSV